MSSKIRKTTGEVLITAGIISLLAFLYAVIVSIEYRFSSGHGIPIIRSEALTLWLHKNIGVNT